MSYLEAIGLMAVIIIIISYVTAAIESNQDQRKREKEREVSRKWQLKNNEAADSEK